MELKRMLLEMAIPSAHQVYSYLYGIETMDANSIDSMYHWFNRTFMELKPPFLLASPRHRQV